MEIKGVLFDKDGTLIDFFEVWGTAVEPVLSKILQHYGVGDSPQIIKALQLKLGIDESKIDPEGAFAWKTFGMIADDITEVIHSVTSDSKIEVAALETQLIELFHQQINEIQRIYPSFTDPREMMKTLAEMEVKVGIATADELRSTQICMEELGIAEEISFYGTAGMELPTKPDAEMLLSASRQWGIPCSKIAVVGDTPNDMRFARNAGAVAIAVLSGTGKREDLEPLSDYIIDSVDSLIPLLKGINQKEM